MAVVITMSLRQLFILKKLRKNCASCEKSLLVTTVHDVALTVFLESGLKVVKDFDRERQ